MFDSHVLGPVDIKIIRIASTINISMTMIQYNILGDIMTRVIIPLYLMVVNKLQRINTFRMDIDRKFGG